MSRFTEFDLDKKQLTPISGYWFYPLVSLEQALAPILPQIDQLDRSIKEAKKHCHYPSEHGLTRDESAAVLLYTMEGGENSFYRVLNQALREEDRRKLKPWFAYLKLFDTALGKLPTMKACVWRGMSGDVRKNYEENELFTWWSVSSCSSSIKVVQHFLGSDKNSTLFMIEAVNGKNLAGYTIYPNEKELILRVGTQLHVKSNALQHGSLHVVHLAEVDYNSHEQLSSAMATVHVTPELSNKSVSGE
jgi:hypothetical protein